MQIEDKLIINLFGTGCGCLKQTIVIAFKNLAKRKLSIIYLPHPKSGMINIIIVIKTLF